MKASLNKETFIKYSFVLLILSLAAPKSIHAYIQESSINVVDHKTLQLGLYLDLIRYNSQEKIGILPYILQKPEGIYLEIGTGGDPVADILAQIPSSAPVTLIASDIDENVLNSLPYRHPELQKHIDAIHGPKLKLLKLNAIDMSIFEDNYLYGINASAVLHEIISYAGGFEGMDKFFKEATRTLKEDGVLIYRDPEGIFNKSDIVKISLKDKPIRLFTHIFLYKFLDSRGSLLAKSGRKLQIYQRADILFKVYKKNEIVPVVLTYDQYLEIPSYDIDFSRNYVVTLPCGLYRELARHYITYLHQCNPLVLLNVFLIFTQAIIPLTIWHTAQVLYLIAF